MNTTPKHPDIAARIVGSDGNALSLISAVSTALRNGGVAHAEVSEFQREAMSGDYDHVLATIRAWVSVA